MHFTKLDKIEVGQEVELVTQLELEESPLKNARVRYEIWSEKNADKKDWVTAEESSPGEYRIAHRFAEADTFTVVIHVEDDEDLHEHEEHIIDVNLE